MENFKFAYRENDKMYQKFPLFSVSRLEVLVRSCLIIKKLSFLFTVDAID